ncbi:MAG: NAD(P)-dependent alcohol dehydrogenase [Actinomycetota bacterium]
MWSVVRKEYGNVDALRVVETPRPTIADDEILVAVHASSVNPYDRYIMMGQPRLVRLTEGLRKPRTANLGSDYAGEVAEVGSQVKDIAVGERVFGLSNGTWSQFIKVKPQQVHRMPHNMTFAEAACVPLAGLTAIQALAKVGIAQGQRVLVIGASGGVGTFAVQLARVMGAQVTGVCSGRNVELVQSLGTDDVIDYQKSDYTAMGRQFDVVFDAVGDRPIKELSRIIVPGGAYLAVGAAMDLSVRVQRTFGPLVRTLRLAVRRRAHGRRWMVFLAKGSKELDDLTPLIEAGSVRTIIDQSFNVGPSGDATEIARAVEYLGTHRARGKVALLLAH